MVSDKEHDALKNQYHIVVARCKDLQEQLSQKQKQWELREGEFKNTEKIMRELCEDILAKDSREMVLGSDYSWSSIPINDLIRKSKKVLVKYIESRKDFMRKLMDQSEERRMVIEGLEEQISIMKTQPGNISISQEELVKKIEKEKQEKEAIAQMTPAMQQVVNSGRVKIVMEETDDFDLIEESVYKDVAEKNATVQITPKSIPVTNNRKQVERKKKRKEQAMMAHTIDLKEYEDKMDDVAWLIMEVIGTEGISIYTDMEASIFKKNPTIVSNKIRTAIGILYNMGVINKEPVKIPLKGSLFVYQLTDIGSRLYKDKFGKTPIPSEMDIIMAEHDNCTHGYSIKFIAEALRDSGYFKDVNDKNRKNPIVISDGVSYIPDIVCTDKNNAKMYIEYECVNHTQTNFNAKCNKMCKVTSVLNFVTPNQDAVEKIMKQIESWINNRGAKSLEHVTVRITSAVQIKNKDITKNENWKIVYKNLGKGVTPISNF